MFPRLFHPLIFIEHQVASVKNRPGPTIHRTPLSRRWQVECGRAKSGYRSNCRHTQYKRLPDLVKTHVLAADRQFFGAVPRNRPPGGDILKR